MNVVSSTFATVCAADGYVVRHGPPDDDSDYGPPMSDLGARITTADACLPFLLVCSSGHSCGGFRAITLRPLHG